MSANKYNRLDPVPDQRRLTFKWATLFLFILTAIVMFIFWKARRVTRLTGWILCALYASFVGYAVLGALGIIEV